jgi:hypothetical protein
VFMLYLRESQANAAPKTQIGAASAGSAPRPFAPAAWPRSTP